MAALGVALGACGGGSPASTAGPREIVNQAFSTDLTDAVIARDHAEYERIIAECMAAEGYEYVPVPMIDAPRKYTAFSDILLISVGHARASGYGVDMSQVDMSFVDPNEAILNALTDDEKIEYFEALSGPPVGDGDAHELGGCSNQAETRLEQTHPETYLSRTDMETLESAADRFVDEVRSRQSDPALTAWSTCMSASGYSFSTPFDARASADDGRDSEAQDIAIADAECQAADAGALRRLSVEIERTVLDGDG